MPCQVILETELLGTVMLDTATRHCAAAKSYVNFAA